MMQPKRPKPGRKRAKPSPPEPPGLNVVEQAAFRRARREGDTAQVAALRRVARERLRSTL